MLESYIELSNYRILKKKFRHFGELFFSFNDLKIFRFNTSKKVYVPFTFTFLNLLNGVYCINNMFPILLVFAFKRTAKDCDAFFKSVFFFCFV